MNKKNSTNIVKNFFSHTAMGTDIFTWVKVLSKYKGSLRFSAIPKLTLIVFLSLLNAPFQFYERKRFSSKIKNVKLKDPVFILGYFRSGTTYLQYLLSQDPQFAFCESYKVLMPHVFLTMPKFLKFILNLGMSKTRPQDNIVIGPELPMEEEFALANLSEYSLVHAYCFPQNFNEIFDQSVLFKMNDSDSQIKDNWKKKYNLFLKKIALGNGDKRLLLKSPANTGRLESLLELYPNAKFIYLHRDPKEVFLSNEILYKNILPILSFQKISKEQIQDFIFYSYKCIQNHYREHKHKIPKGNLYEMKYEDLSSNPQSTLENAYRELGIDGWEKAASAIKLHISKTGDYKKNDQREISLELSKRIKREMY